MAIEIVTYGHYLGSSNPWKREFFIEATNTNGEPVDLEELVRILAETERMLSKWVVITPEPEPWYRVRTCKYCEEIVKRRYQKKKEMFYDWWFQYCPRHATVEFLGEISIFDNKERRIEIGKGMVTVYACTCRHEARYFITSTEITAELDNRYRFRYKPHTNAWPFEPSFNMVVRKVLGLVHELREILESPPRVQLYYNGELIHHP